MGHIACRLAGVSESVTLKLNATVQALKAQGVDVINLTAGEPDFWVSEQAKQAVYEAVKSNCSRYTSVPGILELRQAIADKTNAQQPALVARGTFGTSGTLQRWKAMDVVVSNGGKQALFNSFMALIDPGDEVIIPSPYWLSYPEMVKIAGGIPKIISTSMLKNFKITPEQLAAALNSRVRILVFNSPSNPTGAVYSREEFAALAEVLEKEPFGKAVWVISDEIYDRMVFHHSRFCSFLEAAPQLQDRTITVNGMSKSAAMTGWRVGWSLAPQEITQAITTLQGQSTSNVNTLAQWASLAALKIPESEFSPHVQRLSRHRDLCLDILRKASKIELFPPDGAFYLFVRVGNYFQRGEDSIIFSQRLLEEAKVAVVPGTLFGEPEFVRLSFATDEQTLREGCERIVKFLWDKDVQP